MGKKTVPTPPKITPTERIARARALRAGLSIENFKASDIDVFKRASEHVFEKVWDSDDDVAYDNL